MMNKFSQFTILIFTIISLFSLSSCAPPKPKTPMSVAQTFWTAALNGDIETAKQFLTPESQPHFKLILKSNRDYVELGEQSITTTRAEILTQLTQHHGEQTRQVALRTILINQQGQWLVDFKQTKDSMLGSELQSAFEQLSNTWSEAIDKGMKVMGESMKEELEEMDQAMQEQLEEWNKELEQQQQKQAPPKNPNGKTM